MYVIRVLVRIGTMLYVGPPHPLCVPERRLNGQIDRDPVSQVWHDDIDPSLLQALSAPSIGLNPAALQLGFIGNGDVSIEVKKFLARHTCKTVNNQL